MDDVTNTNQHAYRPSPATRAAHADEHHLEVGLAAPGTYTAADLGLSDLDDDPIVYVATTPEWPTLVAYATDPARARTQLRATLSAVLDRTHSSDAPASKGADARVGGAHPDDIPLF